MDSKSSSAPSSTEAPLAGPLANNTGSEIQPQPPTEAGPLESKKPITQDPEVDISPSSTYEIEAGGDPYALQAYKRDDVLNNSTQQVPVKRSRRKTKKIKKYYNRQNALIDAYLGSHEEEQAEVDDTIKNGGKVKFAVNASFVVNFFLFVIQMYAAISTGSLSLFATAADAFVRFPLPNINTSILWLILLRWILSAP